jgi:UDP-N-acetyl-D-mannosaminuronic acid dehydrogenase
VSQKKSRRSTLAESTNIVVIGMGYVGIPCAALLADVPGFRVTGIQRRSKRSGWKIDCLNGGGCPFESREW